MMDSILWYQSKGGKNTIRRMLFENACEDCIDELYKLEPVKLRKIQSKELEAAIHWQVMRDRNNWRGRKPKRAPFTGAVMDYDFLGSHATIEQTLSEIQAWQDLTGDSLPYRPTGKPGKPGKPKRTGTTRQPPKKETNAEPDNEASAEPDKEIGNCLHCRVDVWKGAKEECPKVMGPAHPMGTNWQVCPNVQPYCAKCWTEEQVLLAKMGSHHRAVGPKVRDAGVAAGQAAATARAISAATAPPPAKRQRTKKPKTKKPKTKKPKTKKPKTKKPKTSKPKTSKQLGGMRVVPPKPPVPRWQVCVHIYIHYSY